MDIFIDNKKLQLGEKKDFKTLSLAMEEINKVLQKEGKMLSNIYINGRSLTDNSITDGEKIDVLEVLTKSPRGIILEALLDMDLYIEKYFETMEVLDEELELEGELGTFTILFEIVSGLEWVYNILMSIKENTALDLYYQGFDELVTEYRECMDNVSEALESRDNFTLHEILNFEIEGILAEIKENISGYYEEILKEETRDNKFA